MSDSAVPILSNFDSFLENNASFYFNNEMLDEINRKIDLQDPQILQIKREFESHQNIEKLINDFNQLFTPEADPQAQAKEQNKPSLFFNRNKNGNFADQNQEFQPRSKSQSNKVSQKSNFQDQNTSNFQSEAGESFQYYVEDENPINDMNDNFSQLQSPEKGVISHRPKIKATTDDFKIDNLSKPKKNLEIMKPQRQRSSSENNNDLVSKEGSIFDSHRATQQREIIQNSHYLGTPMSEVKADSIAIVKTPRGNSSRNFFKNGTISELNENPYLQGNGNGKTEGNQQLTSTPSFVNANKKGYESETDENGNLLSTLGQKPNFEFNKKMLKFVFKELKIPSRLENLCALLVAGELKPEGFRSSLIDYCKSFIYDQFEMKFERNKIESIFLETEKFEQIFEQGGLVLSLDKGREELGKIFQEAEKQEILTQKQKKTTISSFDEIINPCSPSPPLTGQKVNINKSNRPLPKKFESQTVSPDSHQHKGKVYMSSCTLKPQSINSPPGRPGIGFGKDNSPPGRSGLGGKDNSPQHMSIDYTKLVHKPKIKKKKEVFKMKNFHDADALTEKPVSVYSADRSIMSRIDMEHNHNLDHILMEQYERHLEGKDGIIETLQEVYEDAERRGEGFTQDQKENLLEQVHNLSGPLLLAIHNYKHKKQYNRVKARFKSYKDTDLEMISTITGMNGKTKDYTTIFSSLLKYLKSINHLNQKMYDFHMRKIFHEHLSLVAIYQVYLHNYDIEDFSESLSIFFREFSFYDEDNLLGEDQMRLRRKQEQILSTYKPMIDPVCWQKLMSIIKNGDTKVLELYQSKVKGAWENEDGNKLFAEEVSVYAKKQIMNSKHMKMQNKLKRKENKIIQWQKKFLSMAKQQLKKMKIDNTVEIATNSMALYPDVAQSIYLVYTRNKDTTDMMETMQIFLNYFLISYYNINEENRLVMLFKKAGEPINKLIKILIILDDPSHKKYVTYNDLEQATQNMNDEDALNEVKESIQLEKKARERRLKRRKKRKKKNKKQSYLWCSVQNLKGNSGNGRKRESVAFQ